MDVSVVIVNYNTCALTLQCIKSVIEHSYDLRYEIIVVDNNSSDNSADRIRTSFPEICLIENQGNVGFGQANNIGILNSLGRYVFLLNSDTYLMSNALKTFLDFMEEPQNTRVACCGAALFQPAGGPQVSYGNFPSLLEVFSELGFYRLYREHFQRHISSGVINYSDEIREVDYISGADMFIRRSVLNQVGLFDKDFFLYFEETELALRFKRAGFSSVLLPAARIVHLEGASIQQSAGFNYGKLERFAKSRALFFRKCYGSFQAGLMKFLYCLHMIVLFALNRRGNLFRTIKIIVNA